MTIFDKKNNRSEKNQEWTEKQWFVAITLVIGTEKQAMEFEQSRNMWSAGIAFLKTEPWKKLKIK